MAKEVEDLIETVDRFIRVLGNVYDPICEEAAHVAQEFSEQLQNDLDAINAKNKKESDEKTNM